MQKNIAETLIGAIVLLIAALFIMFAYKWADIKPVNDGYVLSAKFEHIDGINLGSEVLIAGIKIGTVTKQYIDPATYMAVVEMAIEPEIKLPDDSSAQITSAGLLGNKYINITPGADQSMLTAGDVIKYTQSSVNIETLIGKMIFNSNEKKNNE